MDIAKMRKQLTKDYSDSVWITLDPLDDLYEFRINKFLHEFRSKMKAKYGDQFRSVEISMARMWDTHEVRIQALVRTRRR